MKTFVDLSSEVFIDRSRVRDPYLRLLLAAIRTGAGQGIPLGGCQ